MKKSPKPAVFILDHTGRWEFNTLSKPLITDYDWPCVFLVNHYGKKVKIKELPQSRIKLKNVLNIWEKLSFIKQIILGKEIEIGTRLLLGQSYNKTKFY